MQGSPSAGFRISCNKFLIAIQLVVFLGWLTQLVFHQTWRNIIWQLPWGVGLFLSVIVSCLPLICVLSQIIKKPSLPTCYIEYRDCLVVFALFCLGIIVWWFFTADAISFPMHTYGDECFHTHRLMMMSKDMHVWHAYIKHGKIRPDFYAEYMMYPALAYVPMAILLSIFGNINSIPDQRTALVIYYLGVIFTTYLLARLIIKSRVLSSLISAIPLFSALLIAYTMSFYIELPYVCVLLFSFWLLAWGMLRNSKEIITTSVLVASLAPVIRETALPTTFGIVLSAVLWRYLNIDTLRSKIVRITYAGWYFIIGLVPLVAYYDAKSHYTDYDKKRTSLAFIFHQDYYSLFSYSFIYLGPLALVALLYFICSPKRIESQKFLFLASIIGILGSLFMSAIFLPGYMPWSRNYEFYYASFMVLIIVFLDDIFRVSRKGKIAALALVLVGIIWNIFIATNYLNTDKLFHESEVIFDFQPTAKYLTEHQQKFNNKKIYMYCQDLSTQDNALPTFIHLLKLPPLDTNVRPTKAVTFDLIQEKLPKDAKYLVLCYVKNITRPKAFDDIKLILPPDSSQLKNYHVNVKSVDPWSQGRSGVLFLEKK